MKPNRIEYARRLSVQITEAMDARLEQIARSRDEAKAEVVRAALRAFLDQQEDLIGSRKHFTKAFGRRIDQVERLLMATLWMSLQTLHLLRMRLHGEKIDIGELLEEVIEGNVSGPYTVGDLVEEIVAGHKAKPPAR